MGAACCCFCTTTRHDRTAIQMYVAREQQRPDIVSAPQSAFLPILASSFYVSHVLGCEIFTNKHWSAFDTGLEYEILVVMHGSDNFAILILIADFSVSARFQFCSKQRALEFFSGQTDHLHSW